MFSKNFCFGLYHEYIYIHVNILHIYSLVSLEYSFFSVFLETVAKRGFRHMSKYGNRLEIYMTTWNVG